MTTAGLGLLVWLAAGVVVARFVGAGTRCR